MVLALALVAVGTLGVDALVNSRDAEQRRAPEAVLVQAVRRTADRSTLTYAITLDVEALEGRRTLVVTGATDTTTATSAGVVRDEHAPDRRSVRFVVQGRRLLLEPPARGAWMQVDLLEALQDTDDPDVSLLAFAVQRPMEMVTMLQGVSEVSAIDRDSVDGIEAMRYSARIAFDRALSARSRFADPDLLRVLSERLDGEDLGVDAWVDANGKLRRLAFGGSLDGGRAYGVDLRISGYGHTVPVELPSDTTVVQPLDLGAILSG
jgi:hypothetical protein